MEEAVVVVADAAAVLEVVVDVDGSACFCLIVSSSRERIRAIKIYCQQGHRSDILATRTTLLPCCSTVDWAKIRKKLQFREATAAMFASNG